MKNYYIELHDVHHRHRNVGPFSMGQACKWLKARRFTRKPQLVKSPPLISDYFWERKTPRMMHFDHHGEDQMLVATAHIKKLFDPKDVRFSRAT